MGQRDEAEMGCGSGSLAEGVRFLGLVRRDSPFGAKTPRAAVPT